nr:hypothetical protein [Tanacetum cinerariifolium]
MNWNQFERKGTRLKLYTKMIKMRHTVPGDGITISCDDVKVFKKRRRSVQETTSKCSREDVKVFKIGVFKKSDKPTARADQLNPKSQKTDNRRNETKKTQNCKKPIITVWECCRKPQHLRRPSPEAVYAMQKVERGKVSEAESRDLACWAVV